MKSRFFDKVKEENVRVYELARQIGVSSKELMERLSEMGHPVNSHMVNLDEDIVLIVKESYAPEEGKGEVEEKQEVEETPEIKEDIKEGPEKGEDLELEEETKKEAEKIEEVPANRLRIEFPVTTRELAAKLNLKPNELIGKLMSMGMFASINQNLDRDVVEIVLNEYGYELEEVPTGESFIEYLEKRYKYPDKEDQLQPRPPIVTLMGHVDHGKTLLLDTIKKTRLVDKEVGGITQHIGAYEVTLPKGKIVFLDTPGHEAFTAMRARGATLTDIAVLVVAADEGVMPQTLEALDHARAAGVPIVVALNKIDKPNSNPEKVKRQLVQYGVMLEGWGGDVICCEVSAKTGQGIQDFLEMLLLQAEIMELKANPNRPAWGTVVEARLTSSRGPVATVIVRNGSLRIGDPVICGMYWGKIKAMVNDMGNRITEAPPGTPVEITGLDGTPDAGSDFYVVGSEREAKEISSQWKIKMREKLLGMKKRTTLGDLYRKIELGLKELKLIVKADVQGSVEALSLALERLSTDRIAVHIVHQGVGDITETDINLAIASDAIIIGFHVKLPAALKNLCKKNGVEVRLYNIIYQAVEDIRNAMEGLLEPRVVERELGRAKVLKVFKISKVGEVAGCIVESGKIVRNASARIIREGEVIFEDQITSLKRFKDEVKEVESDYECGLRVGKFEGYKPSDIITVYTVVKEEQHL